MQVGITSVPCSTHSASISAGGHARCASPRAYLRTIWLARSLAPAWSPGRVPGSGRWRPGGGAPDLAAMCAVALALRELTGAPVRLADLLPESPLRQALLGRPVARTAPADGATSNPRHVPGWGAVEDRVVAQLGAGSEATVAAAARKLYGRMGSEERDARAGAGASPQKRGREARGVIAELTAAVQDVASQRRT